MSKKGNKSSHHLLQSLAGLISSRGSCRGTDPVNKQSQGWYKTNVKPPVSLALETYVGNDLYANPIDLCDQSLGKS